MIGDPKADRAVKRARKLLAAMRAGEENRDAVIRAIDRVYDHANRLQTEEMQELAAALQREVGPADDAGRAARIAARNVEIARLTREIREAKASEGGFERELAIMRGRR